MSRRLALRRCLGAVPAVALLGCIPSVEADEQRRGSARLTARPRTPDLTLAPGRHDFGAAGSAASLYIPAGYRPDVPAPLVVFLHGALKTVDAFMDANRPIADDTGVAVLMPQSLSQTWDAIRGDFGADVTIINAALDWAFRRCHVNPDHVVLSGFSDGGTYVLAIGRANSDLFTRIVAYAPGFLISVTPTGRSPILITHGTQDSVLPIDATSRRIVPALRSAGYTVDYREFNGPHAVPLSIVREMMSSLSA
jgi:predicted esterase